MTINKPCWLLCLCLALICNNKIFAATLSNASNLYFSGYVKSYGQVDRENQQYLFVPVRLMANYQTDHAGVMANYELHYGLTAQLSNEPFQETFLNSEDFRLTAPSLVLNQPTKQARILQNIDRLNAQYQLPQGELTIGRQVLSFGLSRFINPTDIFKPYGLLALDQEYRVGIDAVSFRKYLGAFSVLNVGAVSMQDGSGLFVKAKHTIEGIDMEWVALDLPNGSLVGFSMQTNLQSNSVWLESASMLAKDSVFSDYNRSSVGIDMSFFTDSLLSLEWHYNQAGSKQADQYLQTVSGQAYQQYGVTLLGQRYALASFSYTVSPLWNLAVSAYGNLDDHSNLLNILASTSWSDDVYGDVSVDYGMGSQGRNAIGASEFSTAIRRFTLSLAYYF